MKHSWRWDLTPYEIWLYATYFLTAELLKIWTIIVSAWMRVILTEVPSWVSWGSRMQTPQKYLKWGHEHLIRPPFQLITEAYVVTPSADKAEWQHQQFAVNMLALCGIGLISNFSRIYVLPCVSVASFILKISDLGVLWPDFSQGT